MMYYPIYWTIVSYIVTILEMFIMGGYCFYRFMLPFMENKKGAFWSGSAFFLMMLFFYVTVFPFPKGSLIIYGIGTLAAFAVACLTDRRNYVQKVFIVVTFYSLSWLTSAMAEILYDHLYSFAENTEYMANHIHMWFALYVGVCVFYLALKFAFMMFGIRCIVHSYAYKYAEMTKKEIIMLTAPSFAGVIAYMVMRNYRMFYIGEKGEVNGLYDILFFLHCAVSVIIIVVVVVLYQSIKAKQEEKLENELLATQIESIKRHIGQVEHLYRNIRGIKHDMANHVQTLERLYEEKETEAARAYSTELKAALAEMTGEIKSGNPVTDVILQEWKTEALKRGIHFHSEFYYPADTQINAFDVSVILNNALQNAMENMEKGETASLFIRSYRKKNAYIIEICNSFTGILRWDTESGLPITSKEVSEHGYGLSNIRRVARKYAGDIDISLKDGKFCLGILMMVTAHS